MKQVELTIEGMTCQNCQNKIRKELQKTKGITQVQVSFEKGTADFCYDPKVLTLDTIREKIQNLGYQVVSDQGRNAGKHIRSVGMLVLIIALYVLLQRTGVLNYLAPAKLSDPAMSYGMLFMAGLLTSVHCIAMCGGINLSQSLSQTGNKDVILAPVLYNAGRVVSYTGIGFVLGLLGMFVSGGNAEGVPIMLQGILKIIAGTLMIVMGINMLGIIPYLRHFSIGLPGKLALRIGRIRQKENKPFLVGLLNGLMPCGPMQAMQIVALGSGNPLVGALSMLLFSLGTVPLMLGLGSVVSALGKKYTRHVLQAGAVLVVVFGLSMFAQGGNLAGFKPLFTELAIAQEEESLQREEILPDEEPSDVEEVLTAEETETATDYQLVESVLGIGSYPEITVVSGIPVKWKIYAPEEVLTGCNYRMIIGDYGIAYEFRPGENIIEFLPEETGTIPYTCWMGMISGRINVIEHF